MDKSPAVRDYLSTKNYQVINVEVPVGDIVEFAVDWIVDVITVVGTSLTLQLGNAVGRVNSLEGKVSYLFKDIEALKTTEGLLPYLTLGDYYSLKFTHDREILDTIFLWLRPVEADVINLELKDDLLFRLIMEVDTKQVDGDITFNLQLVNLGGRVSDLESTVGSHKNIFQQIATFINDPVQWAYELVDQVITRYF